MLLKDKIGIEKWLNQYGIHKYELIADEKYGYVVNVNGHVNLNYSNLKNISIKFNIVKGGFYCDNNKLESLIGCPEIINGGFDCSKNKLSSLEGCPKIINGYFYCSYNKIKVILLNNLLLTEIKNNYINLKGNKDLGELQKITDFNELKELLTIYQEKNNLDLLINKAITNKSLESSDFISKVRKINKI